LNWPYDSPHRLRLGGKLFQICLVFLRRQKLCLHNCCASDWQRVSCERSRWFESRLGLA